jgi:hypothetical protein
MDRIELIWTSLTLSRPCFSDKKVCNVRRIITTIWVFDRWAGPDGQEIPAILVCDPASSCRPRFSMNSFIESFGGKRYMKWNVEDRSWHAFSSV